MSKIVLHNVSLHTMLSYLEREVYYEYSSKRSSWWYLSIQEILFLSNLYLVSGSIYLLYLWSQAIVVPFVDGNVIIGAIHKISKL